MNIKKLSADTFLLQDVPCSSCKKLLEMTVLLSASTPSLLQFSCPYCKLFQKNDFNLHSLVYYNQEKDPIISDIEGNPFLYITQPKETRSKTK